MFRCLSCRGVNWNNSSPRKLKLLWVASHAEAWIEIGGVRGAAWNRSCLSCRGVNWNIQLIPNCTNLLRCLSCRGVNWNAEILSCCFITVALPLMQRRELKLYCLQSSDTRSRVASHAEAWIEIIGNLFSLDIKGLPLMQRRELKFDYIQHFGCRTSCLSCRGVNWNWVQQLCCVC